MEYEYYNQFNLSDELANSISKIISKNEKQGYICKKILVTIPEHQEVFFISPLYSSKQNKEIFNYLDDKEIRMLNRKYGEYVENTIPKKTISLLVIMKNDTYNVFSKMSFNNCEELNVALQISDAYFKEYNGILDVEPLIKQFPYLQEFFSGLDEWRSKTERVTLDNNVINNYERKVLAKIKK